MRKLAIILIITALSAVVSHADYYINIAVNYGIYNNELGSGLGLIPNPGDQAIIQLLYVGPNGIPDYAKVPPENGTLGDILGTAPDGDDALIGQFTFTNDGDLYDAFVFGAGKTFTETYLGPKVYVRVIGAGQDGITPGDWYYQSDIFTASDIDKSAIPPPLPDNFFIDG